MSSTQVKDNDAYNLVLMCSSEREDGSFLASAWDEYRIVSHRCPPREDAKEFLTQQLMVDSFRINSKYVNAASADKERYISKEIFVFLITARLLLLIEILGSIM